MRQGQPIPFFLFNVLLYKYLGRQMDKYCDNWTIIYENYKKLLLQASVNWMFSIGVDEWTTRISFLLLRNTCKSIRRTLLIDIL